MPMARRTDVRKHYKLLNHDGQTEVRTLSDNGKCYFVLGENEFTDLVAGLNEKEDVHCGINQRKLFGKKCEDVRKVNCFYFDIEGIDHNDKDSKPSSYLLTLYMFNYLLSNGMHPVLADSGGGYHIFISLVEPIDMEDFEKRSHIEKLYSKVKDNYLDFGTSKAKIDIMNVALGKLERVIGTYNYRQGRNSKWLTSPAKTETESFIKWMDGLPEIKKKVPKIESRPVYVSTLGCTILEYAMSNKLPEGERNQVICPNFMATNPTNEQIEAFSSAQKMNKSEIIGWKDCKTWKGKFNCPQLREYARKHGLSFLCSLCISQRESGDITIFEGKVSGKQAPSRLILP